MKQTQAVKDDDGKVRFDLIPPGPLRELAEVYTKGAGKYAPRNWERGMCWGRVFAAVMRHLWAWWQGEENDPEDGLSHVAHAAWGCFTLMQYRKTHPELDDRSHSAAPETPDAPEILNTPDIREAQVHDAPSEEKAEKVYWPFDRQRRDV